MAFPRGSTLYIFIFYLTTTVFFIQKFNCFQLDLKLNSEDGGDYSTFISNGEWDLVGKNSFQLKPLNEIKKTKIIHKIIFPNMKNRLNIKFGFFPQQPKKNLKANKSASFCWKYCWRKHKYLLIINACVVLAESFFYFSNNGQPYAWYGRVATTFVSHLLSRRMEWFLSSFCIIHIIKGHVSLACLNCVNFFYYMKPLASSTPAPAVITFNQMRTRSSEW